MTDPTVTALFETAEPGIRALAEGCRAFVLGVLPDGIRETVGGTDIGYGWSSGYTGLICVLALHANWVTLGVAGGAELPDPHNLMRGSGKRHRHVRITQPADLERDGLRELLTAAAGLARPAGR